MDYDERDETSVPESDSSTNQTNHSTNTTVSSAANVESTSVTGSDQHPHTSEKNDGAKGGSRLHNYMYNGLKGLFNAANKPSTSTNEASMPSTENSKGKEQNTTDVSKCLQERIDEECPLDADTFMLKEAPSISAFCKEQLLERINKLEETVALARNNVNSTSNTEKSIEALDGSSKVLRKSEDGKGRPQDSRGENESQLVVLENDSISIMCRICYHESWGTPELGPLVSPCNCRGSVQMVHMACLQRWLSESGTETCDLCGFRFRVRWIQRMSLLSAFFAWICTEEEALQLLMDLALLFAMTPLVIFTAQRCLEASHILFVDRRSSHLLLVSLLLLFGYFAQVSYYFWLISAFFYHAQNWMRWWRGNFGIEILPPDAT